MKQTKPRFGMPFMTSSQETEQALFLQPQSLHRLCSHSDQQPFKPDSSKTLALYKSFTYLLTYLVTVCAVNATCMAVLFWP